MRGLMMSLGLMLAACGGGGLVPDGTDVGVGCDRVIVGDVLPCAQSRVPTNLVSSVSRVFVGDVELTPAQWSYDGHSVSIDACVESSTEYARVSVCR